MVCSKLSSVLSLTLFSCDLSCLRNACSWCCELLPSLCGAHLGYHLWIHLWGRICPDRTSHTAVWVFWGLGQAAAILCRYLSLFLLTWALGVVSIDILNSWDICADCCYGLCVAAVRCEAVTWPEEGFVTCDHAPADLTYRSRCDFRCSEGYVLDGPSSIECTAQGQWSEPVPKCKGKSYWVGKYSFLVTGQTKLCAASHVFKCDLPCLRNACSWLCQLLLSRS